MRFIISIIVSFAIIAAGGIFLVNTVFGPPGNRRTDNAASIKEEESKSQSVSESISGSISAVESVSSDFALQIPQEPLVKLSSGKTTPGEFLVLTITGVNESKMPKVVNPVGNPVNLVRIGEDFVGLVDIKYTYEPGEYEILIKGEGIDETALITVMPKQFVEQEFDVDPNITSQTVDNKAANDEYFSKVQPLKDQFESEILWNGYFHKPVTEYKLTSEFGSARKVNGVVGDRHGGIDMAAPSGTPVFAANSGKVMFAQKIALTGNTIMLEHGLGLKSWYYHMDSIQVKEGEMVEKGQQIGTIGTTGFSTGPHLHFATSIGKTYINPMTLFESGVPIE